jgi:hypothetical protein
MQNHRGRPLRVASVIEVSCSVKGSRCGPHKCLTMAGDGERRLPTFVPVAFESECEHDSQTSDVHRAAGNLCTKLSAVPTTWRFW